MKAILRMNLEQSRSALDSELCVSAWTSTDSPTSVLHPSFTMAALPAGLDFKVAHKDDFKFKSAAFDRGDLNEDMISIAEPYPLKW